MSERWNLRVDRLRFSFPGSCSPDRAEAITRAALGALRALLEERAARHPAPGDLETIGPVEVELEEDDLGTARRAAERLWGAIERETGGEA